MQRILVMLAVLGLGHAVVGHAYAGAAHDFSVESASHQAMSVQAIDTTGGIVSSAGDEAPCKGRSHRGGGPCSVGVLQTSVDPVSLARNFQMISWSGRVERLIRSALDPGFRPPIPVS